MKNYLFILIGLIISFGGLLYISYFHLRWLRKVYLSFITQDLVYKPKHIDGSLNYRLYVPKNKITNKLPLILYLHGAGSRGNDNFKELDNIAYYFISHKVQKNNPTFVLAPQCPLNSVWMQLDSASTPFMHYNQDNASEKIEITLIVSLLNDLINKYPIDKNRMFIIGFSMGATGVWDIITRYPEMFASASVIGGASDTSKAYLLKSTPVWAFTGEYDKAYSPELNERMVQKINSFGGESHHIVIKESGHDCTKQALKILFENNWPYNY